MIIAKTSKPDQSRGPFNYLFLTFVLLFVITSCTSGGEKKTSSSVSLHHGSRFENFVSGLLSMPLKSRDSAVKSYISSHEKTPVIDSDSIFSLYWYGPSKGVRITGDLQNGWGVPVALDSVPCGSNTFYFGTWGVPPDSRLDYQLVINGISDTDPRNPHTAPSGFGLHSEVPMPLFYPNPILNYADDIPHGNIQELMLSSSDTLIKSRVVKVYLPPGYERLSGLPVMYVLDGFEAMEYMFYATVVDNLVAAKKIKPIIVVFVPPVERDPEYITGRQKEFLRVLCSDLVPLVDRSFRTLRSPASRAISGISSGGYFALFAVVGRPDIFLCAAAQSPTLTEDMLDAFAGGRLKSKINQGLKIYVDVGRFDLPQSPVNNRSFLQNATDLEGIMKKTGLIYKFRVLNDGHQWADWRERTDVILEYFFGSVSGQ